MDRDPTPTRPVLYVEDHPVNAMLMAALFENRPGLKLVVAGTGQQALCIAAGLNPVLLLLDMRLPDCHGSQLLPLLRQLPGCETAPAVAVTAEDDFSLADSGFVELWAKPLDLGWVLRRLDALTGGSAPPDERAPAVLSHHPAARPHATQPHAGLAGWR